jgi:chromosome segregation ATPase
MSRALSVLAILAVVAAPAIVPGIVVAQTTGKPSAVAAGGTGGLENSKDYKETQDVINKTQAKIDQLRRDNDIRAKEIEAIANRVGDVISTMSSQGSDNSSLRSEMAKLSGQLDHERETTKTLRSDLAKANAKLNSSREKELEDKLRAVEQANRESEKRLSAALESIAGHARINRQLVSDIEGLQKELDAARKENELIRRLRSSNPSQPLTR